MPLATSVWKRRVTSWRSAAAGSDAVLRKVRRQLAGFGATEQAFLSVCQRLMDLQLRTREIASQTSAIATLLSHDEDSLVLEEVLKATHHGQQGEEAVNVVEGIQGQAREIARAIQSVSPLVRTFDVLGIMTRIESARYEAAGVTFTGLADSVATLSRQSANK